MPWVAAGQDDGEQPMHVRSIDANGRLTLLATKLQVPVAHGKPVARGRLLSRLDEAGRVPITVVSAPPGSGKTTLVAEWSRKVRPTTAWVSLDEGDNDPSRFWSYVVAGLDRVQAGVGQSLLALLQSPQPPPIDTVLTVLINDLSELGSDCALVLDDYHLITTPAIHQAVAFLVDHLPSRMHLILTSRTDPPLPLARWRARGQLAELRSADLGFRAEEADAFLAESLGRQLTALETAQLVEKTEGWAAGLQLVALSLAHRDDVADFVRELRGTQRFILDYLAEEVLARQDGRVQAFLMQTAVLERLHGPLCDAVTGYTDSQSLLVELERANLFLVPLDEERRWYRYHQLFAEFLRGRLQEQHPELAADLHRRAARWFAGQSLTGLAIGHWLAAAEPEQAADLIEQVGQARLMGGELTTLQGWLGQLPEVVIAARPRLCLLQAWLYTFTFRVDEVERALRKAEQAIAAVPSGSESESFASEVAAIRETAAVFQVDVTRFQSLRSRSPDDPGIGTGSSAFLRSVRHLNIAFALEWTGDVASSREAYQELSASSKASGNVMVAVFALSQLADQLVAQGHLRRAAALHRDALDLLGKDLLAGAHASSPVAVLPYLGLTLVLIEWNDLDAATVLATDALKLAQQANHPLLLSGAELALARLRQAQGRFAEAQEALDRADQGAAGMAMEPFLLAYTGAFRARLWLATDNRTAIATWVESRQDAEERAIGRVADLALLDALQQTTLVRALIALGRSGEALDRIVSLARQFEAVQFGGVLIELRMLEAVALAKLGDEEAAVAALARSLTLAAPEGFVRLYADEGAPVASLLARLVQPTGPRDRAAAAVVPAAYLGHVWAACGQPIASSSSRPVSASSLIEPLSEREREVLRLVAAGQSNQEIATALVVEVSTVKTHLLRVYGKLGVHSRTQAISRAQALHLLP